MTRVLWLSDLHLQATSRDYTHLRRYLALGLHATLITGDIIDGGTAADYSALFEYIKHHTHAPIIAVAGNHDGYAEIQGDYPRARTPTQIDTRLNHQIMPLDDTAIIALNSAVVGQDFGYLAPDALMFLKIHLATYPNALIALHHHPTAIGAHWLDIIQLKNAHEFWSIVDGTQASVACGHIHQALDLMHKNTHIYTATSLKIGFARTDDFTTTKKTGASMLHYAHGKWTRAFGLN